MTGEYTMTNTTSINGNATHGQQKKSLAAQLDRLDLLIDALDKVLPEVIAEAVQQAIGTAVQQALEALMRELLTRPELLRALAPQPAAPPAAATETTRKPSPIRRAWSWLSAKVMGAGTWMCNKIRQTTSCVCSFAGAVCSRLKPVGALAVLVVGGLVGWLRRHPGTVALASLVGILVGTVGYLAGPLISSAALGLAGSAASLAGSTLAPVFRFLRELQGAEDEV
jgi:hypothetical protein